MSIVCLCGSTRFKRHFLAAQESEALAGNIVLAPAMFSRALDTDEIAGLHELHRQKIEMADEIVVISPDGEIGESTASEIDYATELGKPVRFWKSDDPLLDDPLLVLIDDDRPTGTFDDWLASLKDGPSSDVNLGAAEILREIREHGER